MKFNNYILNSPTDIQKCTSDQYWNWHERQSEDDQTILGLRLEYTTLNSGVVISTVFLGDDRAGYINNKAILFETIVYDPSGIWNMTKRYVSYDRALSDHKDIKESILDAQTVGYSI